MSFINREDILNAIMNHGNDIYDGKVNTILRKETNSVVHGLTLACIMIKEAQAVDAVPVVRCKECKYYVPYSEDTCGWCNYLWNCFKDDDFCSYGEMENPHD